MPCPAQGTLQAVVLGYLCRSNSGLFLGEFRLTIARSPASANAQTKPYLFVLTCFDLRDCTVVGVKDEESPAPQRTTIRRNEPS